MASTSAGKQSSTTKIPNWLEVPDELMVNILQRLRKAEILKNARKVCTTWRRICKSPAVWKVIDMNTRHDGKDRDYDILTMTKQAVHFSSGELIDISIKGFGNDDLLEYIVQRSSKLKRVCLKECMGITSKALSGAIKRLPQLEELHLCYTTITAEDIEIIGLHCPKLNSFTITKYFMRGPHRCDDNAFAIAISMPGLRYLDMNDKEMSNDGIEAIVRHCRHLEYFDVRWCLNIWLTEEYEQQCRDRIKSFIYDSSEENMW